MERKPQKIKSRHGSPTISIEITDEQLTEARRSDSGGCLIADAIQKQYPEFTRVSVDMATVRVSDRARGVRYVYLTPPAAQHVLLAFDQGWPNPVDQVTIQRAVQVLPITMSPKTREERRIARETRVLELEAKKSNGGDLTTAEKKALTRARNLKTVERPTATGKAEAVVTNDTGVVIVGGAPRVQGPPHPNLLRGRNRHYGAKLAQPGTAFQEAVEEAVKARLSELPLGE